MLRRLQRDRCKICSTLRKSEMASKGKSLNRGFYGSLSWAFLRLFSIPAFPGFLSAAYREVTGTCNRCSGKTSVFAGRHRFIERLADSNNIMKTPVVIISGVMKHADRLTGRIMT